MTITDETMQQNLAAAKTYSLVILRGTEKLRDPESRPLVWEHGRRNFQLRADGVLRIVCPISDGSAISGVGIFDATPEKTAEIYGWRSGGSGRPLHV